MNLWGLSKDKSLAIWLLAACAIFPFFLQTGLDLDAIQRQSVIQMYREWRWQSDAKELRPGSTIIFDRQSERSELEEFFKIQLQKDFKVLDIGEHPRVRAFFSNDTFLHARIEWIEPGEVIPTSVWQGKARFINNGILLGVMLGALLYILGQGFRTISWVSIIFMLLWYVDWNLLAIPAHILQSTVSLFYEIYLRFAYNDWVANEMGQLASLGAFLWVTVLVFFFKIFHRRPGPKTIRNTLLLSFLLEPLFLWMASQFAQWGTNVDWWKVYLGSFLFRFLTVSFLLIYFFRPSLINFEEKKLYKAKRQIFPISALFLSYVFLISGGWAWLHVVLSPETSDTLLRLKIFFVSVLLSFALGSRIFSMWLALLALSILLPPARGYWASAIWFGFLFDGLLIGWWMSPYKAVYPVVCSREPVKHWLAVITIAWIAGVFLSSVGAPLVLCWAMLVLGIWAFLQILGVKPYDDPHDRKQRPLIVDG